MRLANTKEWVELNPLRSWRKGRKLSSQEVALLLEVSLVTVSYWESGTVRPGPVNMASIADLLELGQMELENQWTDWRAAAPGRAELLGRT